MKRSILISLAVLAVAACVTTALLLRRGGDAYRSAIPEDAQAVLEVDLKALAAEGGLSLADAWHLFRSDDVEKSGIRFASPLYGFLTADRQLCVLLPLTDDGEFRSWLESQGAQVERQQGLQWAALDDVAVVFDSRKAIVVPFVLSGGDASLRQRLAALMKKSAVRYAFADVLDARSGAAKLATTLSAVPELKLDVLRRWLPIDDAMQSPLVATLSVRRKSLVLNAELQDKAVGARLGELQEIFRPIRGELLGVGVERPALWLCANICGERLLPLLRRLPEVRTALIALNFCIDADEMLRAIDGDVSLAFAAGNADFSDWLLSAQLSHTDFLQNVASWERGGLLSSVFRFKALTERDFVLGGEDAEVRFGVHDNLLYVTPTADFSWAAFKRFDDAAAAQKDARGCLLYGTLDAQHFISHEGLRNSLPTGDSRIGRLLDEADRLQLRLFDTPHVEVELQTSRPVKDILSDLKRHEQD